MLKHNQPKIADIIRSAIGDRIVKDNDQYKFCKDRRIHKNVCTDKYQLLGFKLQGVDGQTYGSDHNYYQNNLQDIKDLQKKLSTALKEAGYSAERVVLQPCCNKNWTVSFVITTIEDKEINSESKHHAICLQKSA